MGDQPEVPAIAIGGEEEGAGAANIQNNPIPEDAAEGQNMAAQAVQGGQLSSITLFTGTKGLEALTYAEAIDGSLAQFGWTQAQAAQAAISRGGNAVANWIRGERAAGITYNSWTDAANNQRPLRPAFISRFGPVYTTSGAVSAIADLKQRNSENAAAFMDRVKIAVDMLNYNVPEADRNAAFRQGYVRMVVAQFGGGLHEDLRAKVFGVPNPPATIDGALTAASAAEAEKTNHKLVVSLVEETTSTDDTANKEEMSELEKISKGVQDVLAITRQGRRGQNSRASPKVRNLRKKWGISIVARAITRNNWVIDHQIASS